MKWNTKGGAAIDLFAAEGKKCIIFPVIQVFNLN